MKISHKILKIINRNLNNFFQEIRKSILTKKFLVLLFVISLTGILINVNAQRRKKTSDSIKIQKVTPGDTIKGNNPKIRIKVNKKYDKNGNIIRYDSSYTYVYISPDGKSIQLNADSVFHGFKPYFYDNFPKIMKKPFGDFFENDSLFRYNFFDDSLFEKMFNEEYLEFKKMIKRMDSLKSGYIYKHYPFMKKNRKKFNKIEKKGKQSKVYNI